MRKWGLAFLILACELFSFPGVAHAAFSFNIASASASTITSGGQEVEVFLNIINLPSESYFRVSLQKESGGSYYGYIFNGAGEWAKILALSADCSAYYKVSDTSTAYLPLRYKIGDDTEIPNGNYNLKAHRFTKTCTSYTESANQLPFIVYLPTPSPTEVPTPASTPVPAPTPSPTKTPTPASAPTPSPTKTPSPSPTRTPAYSPIPVPKVLGETEQIRSEAKPAAKSSGPPPFAVIFTGLGITLVGVAIFMAVWKNAI